MNKQQAQQILTEFTDELRQLLQRYPQAVIDRADGFFANIIVSHHSDDDFIEVRGRVHCSEQARLSDEHTQSPQ